MPQGSPAAGTDLIHHHACLFLFPLFIGFVEESNVSNGEFKIIVTILFAFSFEFWGTNKFDGEGERFLAASHRQFYRCARTVLTNQGGQFFVMLGGGALWALDREPSRGYEHAIASRG